MIPSKNCISLIKQWEGCRLESYADVGGVITVGWGTTGPGLQEGLIISQNTADAMLTGHIREIGLSLTDLVGNSLSQNQFDACTCFVYNIGFPAFKSSTILKLLKSKDFKNAALEFLKWDHVHGVVVPGLLARRQAEKDLFTASPSFSQ